VAVGGSSVAAGGSRAQQGGSTWQFSNKLMPLRSALQALSPIILMCRHSLLKLCIWLAAKLLLLS
jgi:hypothetical protein